MESSLKNKKEVRNLSEPQKMIYLGESMHPGVSLNTVVTTSCLGNHNDLTILKKVIKEVIEENPGLHIKIDLKNGSPTQYIDNNLDHEILIMDFRNAAIEKEVSWLNSEISRIYTLDKGNLFNLILFYKNDSSLNLLISMHHIICDAWSHQSIATQVYDKYEAILKGNLSTLPPKLSYLEYVETEKNYIDSKRCKLSGDYWKSKFVQHETLPEFYKDINNRARAVSKQFHNSFNGDIQKKILKICDENNISFATFFLACLLISLSKLNDNKKHVLGTLSYNRLGKKEKTAVGMFVNTLPLIFDLTETNDFQSIAKLIDNDMAGLMKNQRYPLRMITNDKELKQLNIANHLDLIYSYQNIILPYDYTYHFSGYSTHPILFRPTRSGVDGDFFLDIDYQIDCFSEDEIINISNIFQNVIENLDYDLKKSISLGSDQFLQNTELKIIKKDHNLNQTLHGIFEDKVLEYPDNIAVTFKELSITYRELNRRANILANMLIELGAGEESPVALLLDRSKEMMIAILAVLKAGSCYLPMSPDQPIKRTEKIVELSGAKIVLCNKDCGEGKKEGIVKLDLRTIEYGVEDVPNLDIGVKPGNLAYIIYTSGSTGEPKGVMVEHKSVINRLLWMQEEYPLNEDDVIMQKTPYTFDVSVWELFAWYLTGSRLHFLIPGAEKEPLTIIESIFKQKITIIHFVPSMLTLFLEYLDGFGSIDHIKTIRRVSCSGEAINTEHVNRFREIVREYIPAELYNLYGPTEATVEVSIFDCLANIHNFVPIGKPIDNVEIYILDANGVVLPTGQSGELHIGGVCLARGYFNKPDLTNGSFKFHEGLQKRLYSTGDLGTYLDDGNIKYQGRIDNQVKIRGNRVELGEIESCLLSIESVSEVAVIAPVDENGNAYLGAYIIADEEIPHADLRHHIQRELPSYMVPSYFIQMDEFPLSSSGKLDRKALPEHVNKRKKVKAFHAPINDREEEICEIWEDELKIEGIGRDENFFDLGGDSLSLIKVHFSLEQKYIVSLQDLFEYQTIEGLAQHIHIRIQEKVTYDDVGYSNIVKQNIESKKIMNYFSSLKNDSDIERVNYSKILITGSTGFLGAYLVKDYLENSSSLLYLLVRADTLDSAFSRLKSKLSFYFGDDFYDGYKERIIVILGDVSEDFLGMDEKEFINLSKEIETVIHSAANVRHYGDRLDMNKINVLGTRNVLDFCNESESKKMFFVSTLSVGLNSVKPGWSLHFTEADNPETNNSGNVYIDSKILAEELVRDYISSYGGQIYRVGNLVSDSETGVFQENREDNGFYKIMNEYKRRNLAPDVDIPFIDLSFIDQTAKAIRLLTTCNVSDTFHLFNPNTITIQDMFYKNETKIDTFKNYVNNIVYGDSVLTHGYYLENINMLGFIPYCNKTESLLNRLGFNWEPVGNIEIDNLWDSWA
ncbi:MAG: amino acid adenylation domain-containing protein [Spirochaetaceae bacterium]